MKEYRLRSDLERAVVDGFAMPLGITVGALRPPRQGYTVAYNAGEEDGPDTYTFQVVVSHEKLSKVFGACMGLLPDRVYPILEVGSRDAYRSVDVFLGTDPIQIDEFREAWTYFEPFFLEDGAVGAGANAEEPFIELFLDQRKSVILHVPLTMRDDAERVLHEVGLEEVEDTWEMNEDEENAIDVRPVLDTSDIYLPDIDELLLQLRHGWRLELNLDPDTNVDEAGRELGTTLWQVVVIAYATGRDDGSGAYVHIWVTADSLTEVEQLIDDEIARHEDWEFGEIYTIDRVAYDERPDELADLPPRPEGSKVHFVHFDEWVEGGKKE